MFYDYHQNNSGGGFDYDLKTGVSHIVVIEADSAVEADDRAAEIGIYFDGVDRGYDCGCCGDRWDSAYGEGDPVPSIYGTPVDEYDIRFRWMDEWEAFIHYADGRIVGSNGKPEVINVTKEINK